MRLGMFLSFGKSLRSGLLRKDLYLMMAFIHFLLEGCLVERNSGIVKASVQFFEWRS